MSLLRTLRNLAVLTILTVGFLSLPPRTVAAQTSCLPARAVCKSPAQCCSHVCRPVPGTGAGVCCGTSDVGCCIFELPDFLAGRC